MYIQASRELGPEDVSRCFHFRGCYVQASMELVPEDVSLLERCPHFRGSFVKPFSLPSLTTTSSAGVCGSGPP